MTDDRWVLDTDACIYWLNGERETERRILEVGVDRIAITVITECELNYGAHKSTQLERNLLSLRALRERVRTLPLSPAVPPLYGQLKAQLEREGARLEDADLLIAAVTLSVGARLVTNNLRHFARIPGLNAETWRS